MRLLELALEFVCECASYDPLSSAMGWPAPCGDLAAAAEQNVFVSEVDLEWLDYHLPEELVAQEAIEPRDHSRLLHLDPEDGSIQHLHFYDLPNLLEPGDLLVLNDTRVTARRFRGVKIGGGARIEVLLQKQVGPGDGDLFIAVCRPGRRLKPGVRLLLEGQYEAEVVCVESDGRRVLRIPEHTGIETAGETPLPPYIRGPLANQERYQTVFARAAGSAAAPTAGLHFTPELLERLRGFGVGLAYVTLDIGLDTFRPICADRVEEHKMHGESFTVPPETAGAIAAATGRIIAVGTTTTRTLESAALGRRSVQVGSGETQLFIRPGYEFKVVDGLITNFHMPRTTMLLLVAAIAGIENVRKAYTEAVRMRYRFLSLGDSMAVLRRKGR